MTLCPPQDAAPVDGFVEIVTDDDPIATRPASRNTAVGCLSASIGWALYIGAIAAVCLAVADGLVGTDAVVLIVGISSAAVASTWFGPSARVSRDAPRALAGLAVEVDSTNPRRPRVWLPIEPHSAPTLFDPDAPGHLAAAQQLRRMRCRDGATLEASGEGLAVHINLGALSEDDASMTRRYDDWRAAMGFLMDRPDPREAWLAAIACTEGSNWRRAMKALDLLGQPAEWRSRRERLLDWITEHGPRDARIAAAVVRVDVSVIDALIASAELDDPVEALLALMSARWRAEPDPEVLTRWRTTRRLVPVLARLPIEGAGADHWVALITDHPSRLALIAAGTAMDRQAPVPIATARAVLDRADVRAQFAAEGQAHPQSIRTLDAALALLARSAKTEDVPRLETWSTLPGPLRSRARSYAIQIKQLAGTPEATGALSEADAESPIGRLNAPDDAGSPVGRLSAPDDAGP